MIAVELKGLPELEKKLEGLAYDMRYKGGRFALRKAAQVIEKAAKENARRVDDEKTAEDIEKNIAIRWSSRQFKRTGDLAFRVGVLGGAGGNLNKKEQATGLPGGDTRHWRFIEYGSKNNNAQPLMRNAAESSAQAATTEFIRQYERAIDRALRRQAKAAK